MTTTPAYQSPAAQLGDGGHDLAPVESALSRLQVETPSWGYGDSRTRFAVFPQPDRPRDVFENLRSRGLRAGAVNPNLFQDPDYRLGSITNPDAGIRRYATDIAGWGSAVLLCQSLGERARVLVDLGHHAQGVNVEQIVAILADEGRLGGFHFNNRKYADDDLIVGSVKPFELFLIFVELGGGDGPLPRLTIDQSHNVEPKIEAMGGAADPLAELRSSGGAPRTHPRPAAAPTWVEAGR